MKSEGCLETLGISMLAGKEVGYQKYLRSGEYFLGT
jgi:hypothetical protein